MISFTDYRKRVKEESEPATTTVADSGSALDKDSVMKINSKKKKCEKGGK